MPEHLRALIYILILTLPTFFVAGRLAIPIIGAKEFAVWRNTWLAATGLVFLTADFLLFTLLLALLTIVMQRRAKDPVYLYLVLMFVAPSLGMGVGIPGIFGRLIDLNAPRVLALVILVPMAVRLWSQPAARKLRSFDIPITGFCLMLSVLSLRYGDVASVVRSVPGYFLDILLPYFVFSRAITSAADVNKCLLAFVVAAMPLAAIGIFEYMRDWRIYYIVVLRWDMELSSAYLFRDGALRAAGTAIEAIAFGFLCMVGAAALLAIRSIRVGTLWWTVAFGLLTSGLYASLSRGPWLGFAMAVAVVLLVNPKASLKLLMLAIPVIFGLVLGSAAIVQRFINLLPFVGQADVGSETYRSDLFVKSMEVIQRNPLFGSLDFSDAPELQSLIQGQGIIDIVNSYIQIALEYGLVTLAFFVIFFGAILVKFAGLSMRGRDPDLRHEGALGLMVAILFTIATTSSVSIIPYIYWAVGGLAVGWIGVAEAQRRPLAAGAKRREEGHASEAFEGGIPPAVAPLRVLGRGV